MENPGVYDCHVDPPFILDSYSSTGFIPPLPPLNVAETDPDTHTSDTAGLFVIVWATGWENTVRFALLVCAVLP